MPLYGTQTPPMPGQAVLGYGPHGQAYNQLNPVAMTTSGIRPLSVAAVRVTPAGQATAPVVSQQTQQQLANYVPPAWTAAGKRLAAMQQQQFGMDFYGNPAATGGLSGAIANGGGYGNQAGVSTGIGGNLPNLSAFRNAIYNPASRVPGLTMAQQGELGQQYNNIFRPLIQRADLDLSRTGAEQLAGLNRQFQVGRANAGLGWANLGQRINEIGMDDILGQQGLQTDRLRLIASILGGMN